MNATDGAKASGTAISSNERTTAPIGRPLDSLNEFLERFGTAACVWDGNLRLIAWNVAYSKSQAIPDHVLKPGARLAEILNHGPGLLDDTRNGDELEAVVRQTLATEGGLELNRVHADGRVVSVTYDAFADDCWIALYHDVTKQRNDLKLLRISERALRLQKAQLDASLDSMPYGFSIWDDEYRLVLCNRRYAETYDLPRESVREGVTLLDVCELSIAAGNYPGMTPDALYRLYRKRLDDNAESSKPERYEMVVRDRTIRSTFTRAANIGWVVIHEDITDDIARMNFLKGHEAALARSDSLTNLPNRLMFREIMEAAELRINRNETLAVLAVDLDRFKWVNDTLGHDVGDGVLRQVAERLRACCREGDLVSRLGGDEFAVLTGSLKDGTDAAPIAERIVRQMAEPFRVDGHTINIGASVGISVSPIDALTSEALLKNADLALYRAKDEGRGAYHFFEKGMDARLEERRALERGLRQALALNEFRLVFQPLFNLKRGRICCLQALLRWYHPERGTIAPKDFIPIAEDTGLIVAIGQWVLHEACRAAVAWPAEVRVAVKLSGVQFRKGDLLQQTQAALDDSGLTPARLEFEVTESLLVGDTETTLKTLGQLRRIGVRVALADFGTGHSSLGDLRSFPFDKIKIDQSLVRDLPVKEDSRAIVNALVGIGRSLGMSTTAEGVETEAQLEIVRQQGCTEVQGFLFSPPLPASAITKLFAETAGMDEWTRTLRKVG